MSLWQKSAAPARGGCGILTARRSTWAEPARTFGRDASLEPRVLGRPRPVRIGIPGPAAAIFDNSTTVCLPLGTVRKAYPSAADSTSRSESGAGVACSRPAAGAVRSGNVDPRSAVNGAEAITIQPSGVEASAID
jgi:hypothetical protein